MATQITQALDPRLRRLVASLDDVLRLRRDLDQSLVTTAEATPSEAVAAVAALDVLSWRLYGSPVST